MITIANSKRSNPEERVYIYSNKYILIKYLCKYSVIIFPSFTKLRSKNPFYLHFLFVCCFISACIVSCNAQKENVASRGMQNLTAHYNILYNAGELINESERNIKQAYIDNFDRVIAVYKEPSETLSQPELKKLDDAILKANTIVNEKSLSKYVDDAYFLIGKANHLKSNFFNAVEFFNYVYSSYPNQKEIKQASLAWKARSLLASDRLEEAEAAIDSAFKYIKTEKKSVADIYAVKAQLHIYAKQDIEAIKLLQLAISNTKEKQNKIRWTYLIAQLQQINELQNDAILNYTKVLKSNAPFEMAFNANLNRINLKTELSGDTGGRTKLITALLKDEKNKDFTDQIYYQIGSSFENSKQIDQAIENYKISISKSTKNQNQKGLSYLKLAEIYLSQYDFLNAKAYFDSTLITLPKLYPGYDLIKKKTDNLELLADRLNIIEKEETLQMIAGLSESERIRKIDSLVHQEELRAELKSRQLNSGISQQSLSSSNTGDNRFYFNNLVALKQGIDDFKKRWGNRKLEDNWRRSQKSAAEITNLPLPEQVSGPDPFLQPDKSTLNINKDSLRKAFTESIPLNKLSKDLSDQKIALALYDVANYYREVSLDTAEAVKTYEQLIQRFPENPNQLAVYYNLYRIYRNANSTKSDQYKNILLNRYPSSPFAKIILDPEYDQKNDERQLRFNQMYNEAYDAYTKRKYAEVISSIDTFSSGKNSSAQLDYLRTLALGHTQKLDKLEQAFKEIIKNYPEEKLIVPLVKEHLAFIDSNRFEMQSRATALIDHESERNRFIEEPKEEQAPAVTQTTIAVAAEQNNPVPVVNDPVPVVNDPVPVPNTVNNEPKIAPPVGNDLFSAEESGDFYFVVNVSDPSVNLSSSRFGIGQFNRVNLPGVVIKHQLKSISNQNQLIYVGPIAGKVAAAEYYNRISQMMAEVMKIPATKYSTFYISQKNLDKITDKDTLDKYVEFYKMNY